MTLLFLGNQRSRCLLYCHFRRITSKGDHFFLHLAFDCIAMHLFMCARVLLYGLAQLIAPGLIDAAKAKVIDFSKWYASSDAAVCRHHSPSIYPPYFTSTRVRTASMYIFVWLCRVHKSQTSWKNIMRTKSCRHVFFVDERFVPLKHEDNNFRCAMISVYIFDTTVPMTLFK